MLDVLNRDQERMADLSPLPSRDRFHIVGGPQYPERRRGFWPYEAPGNLVERRQGANASPATGTIRLEPSNHRCADPSIRRGFSFLPPGHRGQSPPPGRNT